MIRKVVMNDLKNIMSILNKVKEEMHEENNYQWDDNYPLEKDFANDINDNSLYAAEKNGMFAGFICINKTEPKEYDGLNWSLKDEAYVIHRMAVNPDLRNMGIGTELMNYAEKLAMENNSYYLKTDTYSENIKMNSLFVKSGYKFADEMSFLGKEKPFNCYEKVLENKK